jgi:Family of unknown function (DUF5681)
MTDDADPKSPHGVGYRQPPKQTQFVKGKSGNPKGRPKGSRGVSTVLNSTVNKRVKVTENGRRRSITKLEASLTQLCNKAASGDLKATHELLQLVLQLLHDPQQSVPPEGNMGEADQAVMESILGRFRCTLRQQMVKTDSDGQQPDIQKQSGAKECF